MGDVALQSLPSSPLVRLGGLVACPYGRENRNEEKEAMVRNLFRRERKASSDPDGKRFSPDIDLKDLVTSRTRRTLDSLLPGREEEVGNPLGEESRDMGD
ncbi:hypothetical protein GWK47_036726 [Chionoecetes opilio]|uniref:Uncharacterized protein n=1 Tax=Chionoecetes opilio TaxID=41210 RepID=A0A8J5CZK9_CHIOP|nr:hypothetical protein GWK47_036726 [Chionoecetes opilio]